MTPSPDANLLGLPSRHDIFLSPHSDDVCFSLGFFASQRRAGTLLTLFPVSSYRADEPQGAPRRPRVTTRMRLAEDACFAAACGLQLQTLEHMDAASRHDHPFDATPSGRIAAQIGPSLMQALMGPTLGRHIEPRPWLFCPAGIGGHVDHVAVMKAVIDRLASIAARYRVAFYEDLHYAADAGKRDAGLQELHARAGSGTLRRQTLVLDACAVEEKMRLIRLYASQLKPSMQSIRRFTPADPASPQVHEALWVLGEAWHQA